MGVVDAVMSEASTLLLEVEVCRRREGSPLLTSVVPRHFGRVSSEAEVSDFNHRMMQWFVPRTLSCGGTAHFSLLVTALM